MTTSAHTGERPPAALIAQLPEPKWARVSRIQLIRREVRETLSASAVDVLFAHARHVVEGSPELGARANGTGRRVYATVMVTIDLVHCAQVFREPPDAATAERVAELLADGRRVRSRLASLARPELALLVGVSGDRLRLTMEHDVRSEGTTILIDIDAMATVDDDVRSEA